MTDWPICITVAGKAAPAGSKTSFIPKSNELLLRLAATTTPAQAKAVLAGLRANIVDANPNAAGWKDIVAWSAVDQYKGDALTCAVDVEMIFVMARPKAHYGTGRNADLLKDNAPLQPTVAPDVLKLARGVEDALTGIVYRDDAQIVNESLQKRYGNHPRVEIRVRPTTVTCVRDLLMMGDERPARPTDLLPFEQLTLA